MKTFEQELHAAVKRWRLEAREIERGLRNLTTHSEKLAAQTHAHTKEALAGEVDRLMQRYGVKATP